MTGATIFPAHIERVGYRTHRWAIADPIRYDRKANKDEECLRVTTEALSMVEKQILDDPTQYFWFNKRWVLTEEVSAPPPDSTD